MNQLSNSEDESKLWLSSVAPALLNYSEILDDWQQKGGLCAGYLSNNIPLEILWAAEIYPVHLKGNPDVEPTAARQFMEPAFDPITLSVFNGLLTGQFDYLDFLVLPRGNDAHQRLYYYLCELKRNYSEYELQAVKLVDILQTLKPSTDRHNLSILEEFVSHLESKINNAITEEMLQQAISEYNLSRKLLEEFTGLRRELPLTLNSKIAFLVYEAARNLPVTDFNNALKDLLDHCRELPGEDAKRVLLAGNGLDYSGLHSLADNLGAAVVGDYHAYGNHFLSGEIDSGSGALAAISNHYQRDVKGSRSTAIDPDEVLEFAKQQKADGVIFFYLSGEEAWTWHLPEQKSALQQAGIPTLVMADQPYTVNDSAAREIEKFIAGL